MKKIDLLVIGTGPAGGQVATKCAAAGWKVAIAESRAFGGTCALRGCNPKKVFVHAAQVVDAARRTDGTLCDAGDIKINWKQLQAFKRTFVQDIPQNSRKRYDDNGIETFLGSPQFISPTQLQIGDEVIEPKHVVIATGGKPRPLEFEGSQHLVTSDQFLDLEELPKKVVFTGGGYISFEFAHVASRAGAEIVILDRGARPLKGFDEDAVAQLVKKCDELGIQIKTKSTVSSIQQLENGAFAVNVQSAGQPETLDADMVVHGAGRVPNIDQLDLKTGGVEFTQAGISVNQWLRSTTNPIVMAAGDCAASGSIALTPTANAEGAAVTRTLLSGTNTQPDYGPVAAVAFTIPAISSVGLTEAQAKAQGLNVEINQRDVSSWGSVRKVGQSISWYKTLVDKTNDKIVGAHLIGPGAAETINVFTVAIKGGLTAEEVRELSLAFPTNSYNIRQMF